MSINLKSILDNVTSHAAASGHFTARTGFEPKKAPGRGISFAAWVQRLGPVRGGSGLAKTSAILEINVRVYSNMLADPPDLIDPQLVSAVDALMTAYSGDFELGGNVRNVDLLGAHSQGLTATAGYLEQDGNLYRVMTINLPLVLSDVWDQVA